MSSTPAGFLDPDALRKLCNGAARANAQEEFLRAERIPYKRQGATVLVLWTHVQAWIEGRERPVSRGINWGAVNA
jgi:hypothetical protein